MNRSLAILVLIVFATGALAVAWWGLSDVLAWREDLRRCVSPIYMDTSSFWFLGFSAMVCFPLLVVTGDARMHKVLFTLSILLFLLIPFLGHISTSLLARAQNYDIERMPSLFSLVSFDLSSGADCMKREE